MNVYRKHEFIEAMKELIKLHAEAIATDKSFASVKCAKNFGKCPLCVVATVKDIVECDICPWKIMTQYTCESHPDSYHNSVKRIAQLAHWITEYERAEEIAVEEKFKPVMLEIKTQEEYDWIYACANCGNLWALAEILNSNRSFPFQSTRTDVWIRKFSETKFELWSRINKFR